MTTRLALFALLGACTPTAPPAAHATAWIADVTTPPITPASPTIADRYRGIATTILAHARADRGAYQKLAVLTDRIGNRIAGSANLDRAIAWAVETMAADGHAAHTEPAMVPHWVRNAEAAELVTPIARPLRMIGLGGSIGTPKGGLTAPVVVVHDWAELDAKQAAVKGAIVLFDVAMPPFDPVRGSGYGTLVEYRTTGAVRAARYGAVAVLMRSVTAHSLRTPHTGAVYYDDAVAKIPGAAVTVEDAMLIARLATTGPVSVHLAMDAQLLPDVLSANVIGELRGAELPDEVVLIGAHLDSWDVGQGAHDDGAGCVVMMQALTTLRALGLHPRRTIRVVLFTTEEYGERGAKQYAKDHAAELGNLVLAVEADSGGFAPRGFSIAKPDPTKPQNLGVAPTERAAARLADLATLLRPLDATRVTTQYGGADIGFLAGVPQVALLTDGRTYFDIHHSEADTLDKVDPEALADDVAAVAVLAYIVADLPERLTSPTR
ncbi:MAG: M20/M25/M40 family metallo-hydrolase [Proteobacteria bacterium]|nr:M20/M25/M40 family metallo-hydrolase [Pseudomonadota bacterium]